MDLLNFPIQLSLYSGSVQSFALEPKVPWCFIFWHSYLPSLNLTIFFWSYRGGQAVLKILLREDKIVSAQRGLKTKDAKYCHTPGQHTSLPTCDS